jgi:ubiquinol-cytochrome c reductase cytochrome c1 subunit
MSNLLTVRLLSILAGIGIAIVMLYSLALGIVAYVNDEPVPHLPYADPVEPVGGWSFDGPLGTWDYAQLQRGYQVYKEVCAACHSLKFVAFRNLAELGYTEAEVKAEAANWQVPGIDPETGEVGLRAGEPTDHFPSPYPNDVAAAAANGGAIPPDLSLMTKARKEGVNYTYSLLIGYQEPTPELLAEHPEAAPGPGLYHNIYFKNLNLAMAPPLVRSGQVAYNDGTDATIRQMSQDVTAFLTWTAEPTLIKRKQTGWPVLGFLLFATVLAYLAKQQIWAAAKPRRE